LAHSEETERVERAYEGYSGSPRKRRKWDAANAGNAAIRRELVDLLIGEVGTRLDKGRFLDVGCGTGWWLAELAARGVDPSRLAGIDLLDQRVVATRQAVAKARIERADARHLPFDQGSFEVLTMVTLLSSIGDEEAIRAALRDALRVLSPGGLLLVYEPRIANPLNRNTRLVSRRILREALGPGFSATPLTVLPPLARALEPRIPGSYQRLRRSRPLLTHRLVTRRT
jgi:ubiquinone/menaquinone biosynthesis C-methylase UbiE